MSLYTVEIRPVGSCGNIGDKVKLNSLGFRAGMILSLIFQPKAFKPRGQLSMQASWALSVMFIYRSLYNIYKHYR